MKPFLQFLCILLLTTATARAQTKVFKAVAEYNIKDKSIRMSIEPL